MFLVCVFCHRSCPDCSHIVLYLLNVVLTRCYIYYMFSLLRTRSFFFVANFKFLCTKENKLLSCFCLFLFLFCLFVFSQILSKLLFFMNPCPICLHYILTSCREMVTMFVIWNKWTWLRGSIFIYYNSFYTYLRLCDLKKNVTRCISW